MNSVSTPHRSVATAGAPAGLVQDNEGALLIADDVRNAVWRITAAAR
jgi:glucose/arabinose dehydrogenase